MRAPVRRSPRRPVLALVAILAVLASLFVATPAQAVDRTISGTVTAASGGAAIPFASVIIYQVYTDGEDQYYDWVDQTETDESGAYSVTLPAGIYRVGFSDGSGDFIPEYYLNSATVEAGTDVNTTTLSRSGINGTLASAGHITGSVPEFAANGGYVTAYAFDGTDYNQVASAYVPSGETAYSIGSLPTGSYRLEFGAESSDYLSEYYDNKSSLETSDAVAVTAPNTTANINASLATAAHITGTVAQFADGGGGVILYGEVAPGEWDYVTETSVEGGETAYDVGGLSAGDYKVQFYSYSENYADEYYNDKPDLASADIVSVGAGATVSGINATLTENGHITGRVSATSGASLTDVSVLPYTLQDVDGTPTWSRYYDSEGYTDESGNYDVALPAGDYRLKFVPENDYYAPEFFSNATSVGAATTLAVTSGGTNSGRNVVLAKGAVISGTVTLPAGSGSAVYGDAEDQEVAVYNVASGEAVGGGTFPLKAGTRTFTYKIGGLSAGTYRVDFARGSGFSRSSAPATVEGQFYNAKPESAGAASATPITVAAGAAKTGINATLRTGGSITGYLLDGAGNPLTGCWVKAYTLSESLGVRRVPVAADGGFRITGLSTGSYRLGTESGRNAADDLVCELPSYYNGNPALTLDPGESVGVAVTVGRDKRLETPLFYGGSAPDLTPIAKVTSPAVSGTFAVGKKLTASAGTWSPAASRVRFQWLRNGVPIAGLVSSSYTLSAIDKGKTIAVRATAIEPGSAPTVFVTTAKTVAAGTLVPSGSNTILGTLKVGYYLKSPYGVPYGATASYRWYRSGSLITGAYRSSYRLTSSDRGKKMTLKVTFTKPGYTTLVKTATKAGTVQ